MNGTRDIRALLVMEQCNPAWPSVPLVAFNFYDQISRHCRTTLVTHERNRVGLEPVRGDRDIVYIPESRLVKRYYRLVARLTERGAVNWPLQHALSYPIYVAFNNAVFRRFAEPVGKGSYDVVHALTPMLPRYPVRIVRACADSGTPFILGPVNGGLPFPPGFSGVARKEFAHFNVLRVFSRLIPGYAETYRRADLVLSGSTYTSGMLQRSLGLESGRLRLVHENGIPGKIIGSPRSDFQDKTPRILFVGRLVAYKGADVMLRASGLAAEKLGKKIAVTIVGDGPERANLEALARELEGGLDISFTGWVAQETTRSYYENADLFCFPSVREFGGAVVLEAFAAGLPSVVPDYGGIGEYVDDGCGIKLGLRTKDALVRDCADALIRVLKDKDYWLRLSAGAIARAKNYAWERKGEHMVALYQECVEADRGRGA